MLFQRNKLQLSKLSQTSYVNWYLEQFYMEIHVNVCTSQSNKSFFFFFFFKKTWYHNPLFANFSVKFAMSFSTKLTELSHIP